jgi:hypothetical protein
MFSTNYHNFVLSQYYSFFQFMSIFFEKISAKMSHNVSAVYDVLAARISKCVAFAGRTKCAGTTAWEWSVAE